jgi:hypothetical protein
MCLPRNLCVAFALSLLFLFSGGCATERSDSSASFRSLTLGIYDAPQSALPEVKSAGFDVVTGEANAGFLRAARVAGLQVLAPSSILRAGISEQKAEEQIRSLDRDPALWGWYLIDEPDLHDIHPETVGRAARFVQRKARKPGIVTVASGVAARTYGKDCDLLFIDFYPVAWSPVSRFAKEMRLASFARQGRPYMAVLQTFDWSHFQEVLGQTNGLRLPSIAEVRSMAYMALALEARGLFFYAYQAGTWDLSESPLWGQLQELLRELRAFAVIFREQPIWWPYEGEYGNPAQMYNEVHEAAVLLRLYKVKEGTGAVPAGHYFVAINTTSEPIDFTFRVPFRTTATRDLRNGESIPIENNWLEQTYAPFDVRFFGPITSSATFNRDTAAQ